MIRKRTSSASRPRGPGFAYSALCLVLVLVVGTLAFTATQPPPPSIAEFAPQAVDTIEDAPLEQSSDVGADVGSGLGEEDESITGPELAELLPDEIEVPRVRRCIGDPPRQTEDPQSPPCVPYWEGDNGGATTPGVTANEIRLAQTGAADDQSRAIYSRYFNNRFEFYGRQITITHFSGASGTCAEQQAAAVEVVEQIGAFGVIDSASFASACFHAELARRGVMNAFTNILFSEAELAAMHPYMWQYVMGHEKLFAAHGEMVCSRLAGGNAVHSSDPLYQRTPRQFGIILQENEREAAMDLEPLYRELSRCGIEDPITRRSQESDDETVFASNTVLQFKSQGITTVICLCTIFKELNISLAASSQNYYPEWILSSYFSNDYSALIKLFWTADHRQNILGLAAAPPMRSGPNEPAYYSAQEMRPDIDPADLDQAMNTYRSLLLLASGIQMAGPQLTPQTFADSLHRTRFPNPPSRSGTVGFGGREHTMTNDLAEFWWSENQRDPSPWLGGVPGTICYADGGARRLPGSWPTGPDPFYDPPCVADPGP